MSASQISKRQAESWNLLTALVRTSEEAKQSGKDEMFHQGLTDEEIFGNIFFYNLAGYETMANTIATGIVLLAAYPEWQEWMAEEINLVFDDQEILPMGKYEAAFPRLSRCLAVMFEILRLYGSNAFIPKSTGSLSQTLRLNGNNHIIPSGTFTMANLQALHTSPLSWGPDSLTWCPSCWLVSASNPAEPDRTERFVEPARGTFAPWAESPRICPGRKLAQVEFVTVMIALFRKHRVQPVLLEGENIDAGKERLRAIVNDSGISAITIQMRRPRDAVLMWRRVD
ncbi:hypothetical protein GJ744_005321 [Endocarpon pusillum]|uniref:Cytochrome P450 n=1 Tax=Endocarpon pusillum TaxID=364733 RepID=A0A8H7E7C8_9EURO|nr:hypothetical protein GJ744_005321 [Endocarpon pusillum]